MERATMAGFSAFLIAFGGLASLVSASEDPVPGDAGLTRQQLVDMALERNATLHGAVADIDQAEAAVDEVEARAWYPHVELEGAFGGPVQEARGNAVTVTPDSRRDRLSFAGAGYLVRGALKLTYPLFTFGRLSATREGLVDFARAARAQRKMKEAEVVEQVEVAAEAVLFAREMGRVLDEADERVATALSYVEGELANDSLDVSETDRDKLTYVAAELTNRRHQVLQLGEEALAALIAVTGWNAEQPLRVAEEPFSLPPAVDSKPEVNEVIAGLPEVNAAKHIASGKEHLAAESSRALLPSFLIVAGARAAYSNVADRQVSPFAEDEYNYREAGIALALKADLDIAFLRARARRTEAAASRAMHDSAAVRQGMTAKYRATVARLIQSHERASASETAAAAAKRWVVAESLDFSAGVGETSKLVDALVAYYTVQLTHLEAVFSARRAHAQYLRFRPELRPARAAAHAAEVLPRAGPTSGSDRRRPILVAANGPLPGWLLAAATEPTAKEALQKNIDQVQRALKGNNAKKLSQLAANLIDFDEFSRATLARFWDQLSETERSDFVDRFSTVIQSNYVGRIQQAGSFSVSITGETPEDEALWVESEAVAEKGSRLKTDYLFVRRSGTWRVVDIRVEGVRLSERYAHSFGRVIRRDGFPALLERLGPKARKKKHRLK